MSELIPFVIIAAAVALVVGPVMLMRPSKRQQRQSRLRQHALAEGLRVNMLPLPEGHEGKTQSCAAYCLPWAGKQKDLSPWLLVKGNYAHEINFSGCWQWNGKDQAKGPWIPLLKALLNDLPESVPAVGNGPQGLCFYWHERGTEVDVEYLATLLRRLQQDRFDSDG